jgi:hypothetical protein
VIGQHKRGRPENRYSVRLRQLNAVEHLTQREPGHPAEWLVEFVRHDPDSHSGLAEAAMFFLVLEYGLVIHDPTPFVPVPRPDGPTVALGSPRSTKSTSGCPTKPGVEKHRARLPAATLFHPQSRPSAPAPAPPLRRLAPKTPHIWLV